LGGDKAEGTGATGAEGEDEEAEGRGQKEKILKLKRGLSKRIWYYPTSES
jgi:hypothetical protein